MRELYNGKEKAALQDLNDHIPFTILISSSHAPLKLLWTTENINDLTGILSKDLLQKEDNLESIIDTQCWNDFQNYLKNLLGTPEKRGRFKDLKLKNSKGKAKRVLVYTSIKENFLYMYLIEELDEQGSKNYESNEIKKRYDQLVTVMNEGVWNWDIVKSVVHFSPRWKDILGIKENIESLTTDNWRASVHPDDLENLTANIKDHFEGKSIIFENTYRLLKSDGTYIWVYGRGIKQLDEMGNVIGMIGYHRDITKERQTLELLEKRIITDEMTGLYNRRHYDDQIKDEMLRADRYSTDLSIIMIDIDLFKQINDTYGHIAGDQALMQIAKEIKNKIRNTDSAYRIGGEEFVIIAPATNIENALKAAERLREAVSKNQIKTKDNSFDLTISLGITQYVRGDTYFTFNERADIALYKSKNSGRNRSSVSPPN